MYYRVFVILLLWGITAYSQVDKKLYRELDKKHIYKPWSKGEKGGIWDYGTGSPQGRTEPNRRVYRDNELREMSSVEQLKAYEKYLERQYKRGKMREVNPEEMERFIRRLERQSRREGRAEDFRKSYERIKQRGKGKYSRKMPDFRKDKRVVEKNYQIDPPDAEDIRKMNFPKTSSSLAAGGGVSQLFMVLGIILIAGVVAYIIYLWLNGRESKKKKPVIQKLSVENEDLSPAEIPKTELELALENALKKGDYRLAVRVYFTFIMKELIERRWVKWEKGKTLSSYQNEMLQRAEHDGFSKTVNLFEIVWFGKRKINQSDFQMIEGPFKNLLNQLGVR